MGVVSNGLVGPEVFGFLPHRELKSQEAFLLSHFVCFLHLYFMPADWKAIAYYPKHHSELISKFQSDLEITVY